MKRILCLWFPNWPIQRWLAEQGKPRSPVVLAPLKRQEHAFPLVLAAEGPRGGRVAACSQAAAKHGVRQDSSVAEAKSLVPALVIALYEPAADRRALEQLAAACEQFSPCVALEEGDAPESLLLDISNLEHLWGSADALAARVEALFTRRGWRVRMAVGPTVGAAWGWARANNEARMTNDECMDSGHSSFVICHSSFAARLPIEALRIPADTASLLRQLGVETVGQVMALPREELTSRFGDTLLRRIDQWTGAAPEVIKPHRPAPALAVEHQFEQPTDDQAALAHVLKHLVADLAARLAARDQGAVRLVCTLTCTDGSSTPLTVGLFEPSACPRQLFELVELHGETVVLTGEVACVTLAAAAVGRLGQRQGELFTEGRPNDLHQQALLVNRLASRLGGEQVLRAELRASPLPERAVRWTPVTERSRVKAHKSRAESKEAKRKNAEYRTPNDKTKRSSHSSFGIRHSESPPRPLLLYSQPRSIAVTCVAPDGPPQVVWLEGRRERVAKHWGPERVETLWWRGPSVRRDYYRVALETGGQLWIFRRLNKGDWFCHGVFA